MVVEDIIKMRNGETALENEGKFWTKDGRRKLMDLYYEGVGISELSLLFQRSERAIVQQINRFGGYDQISKKRTTYGSNDKCHCVSCALNNTPLCRNHSKN